MTALENFQNDLRYGLRNLRRRPRFGAVVVLTLALGIGSSTAILGIAYHVLFKPLPYPHPERLVRVWESQPKYRSYQSPVSAPTFRKWESRNQAFEEISALWHRDFILTGQGTPLQLKGMSVSASFFRMLGADMVVGRGFAAEEEIAGKHRVAVISESLWRRRFGQDPDIVGRNIALTGEAHQVVGVVADRAAHPAGFDVWTPAVFLPEHNSSFWFLEVMARIRPDLDLPQARERMKSLALELADEDPKLQGRSIYLQSFEESVFRGTRPGFRLLLLSAALLLLVSCANVANLFLVRAAGRETEMAVRSAVGAKPSRLAGQLLTESVLLSFLGAALGIGVAAALQRGFLYFRPSYGIPRIDQIEIDGPTLLMACGLALLTALLFGLIPAWRASRPQLLPALSAAGRESGAGSSRALRWLRQGLVVGEIALALMLLAGALLLLRSFQNLMSEDLGFNPQSLVTMEIGLPKYRYPEGSQQRSFVQQLESLVEGLPGVQSWAVANALPFGGRSYGRSFTLPPDNEGGSATFFSVTPDYFATIGLPILHGRGFTEADHEKAPATAIVSASLVKRYFKDVDPVGKIIQFGGEKTIVGVAGDILLNSLRSEPRPIIYIPLAQNPQPGLYFLAKTNSDPVEIGKNVTSQVWAIDPDQPIDKMGTLESLIGATVSTRRLYLLVTGGFSVLALLLAAVGVYSVVSYNVTQRLHEFGVRIALGASPRRIVKEVVRSGLLTASLGVLAGVAGTWGGGRFLRSQLYEVEPTDAATLLTVCATLLLVSLLAGALPALRASRADPVAALRSE